MYGTASELSTLFPYLLSFPLILLCLSQFFVNIVFVAAQSLSCVQLFATPWTAVHQDFLSSKGLSRVFSSTSLKLNSLALNLLYGPTLTSIHDSWKNHSFDYKGRTFSAKWCFCFLIHYLDLSQFFFQGAGVF